MARPEREERYLPIPDPLGLLESAFRAAFPEAPVVPHDPLALINRPEADPQTPQAPHQVVEEGCRYGLECIKDHMLRAHLYVGEAIRFSSGGEITPGAQDKMRLARAQLLCEDDFAASLKVGPPLSYEVLKLLAACRSTWKAIDRAGLDQGSGTMDDLRQISDQVKALYGKAYEIDKRFRESSLSGQANA